MEFEKELIDKAFEECYGLFDSALSAIYNQDKGLQKGVKNTLKLRTGLRKHLFKNLPRTLITFCDERLYYKAFSKQRKELRGYWDKESEYSWYEFIIRKEYERKNNTVIYMTERKTHPSECGWDVSDH